MGESRAPTHRGDELEPPYERTGLGVTKGFEGLTSIKRLMRINSVARPDPTSEAPRLPWPHRTPGKSARKILEKSRKSPGKALPGEGLEPRQQQQAWNERERATERSIAYRLLSVPPRRTTIMASVISRARAIGKMLSMPVTLSAPGPAFAATAVWSRGKHSLPDLPYDYSALEPVISGEIMELHHSKHHQVR